MAFGTAMSDVECFFQEPVLFGKSNAFGNVGQSLRMDCHGLK
jgi:hypothetical protein